LLTLKHQTHNFVIRMSAPRDDTSPYLLSKIYDK